MPSSTRLSEQPSDSLAPYTQARQETFADRSECGQVNASESAVRHASRGDVIRRQVARITRLTAENLNESRQNHRLAESSSRIVDYVKNGVTRSNSSSRVKEVAQMSETVRQAVLKKHVLMTAVAHMMFVALAYLEVFEKEELDEQDRTRIRQRERWLRMKARQSLRLRCQERQEARERQWEREQGISDFDAAIAQAAARERDGTAGSARMREQPSEFRPAYFIQNQRKARQNKDKSRRRLEIQGERHKYSRPFRDDVWLNLVLRDLELSTPADPAEFRRTMETVRLPDGVRAVFKGNTGETILEIMQRTGSHLQILPFRHDGDVVNDSPSNQKATERRYAAGFQSLSLWGTPSENATAIDLLPGLVDAITLDPKASTNLRDYKHTTEETAHFGSLVIPPIRRDEEVDNTDSMYWRQQDQESVSSDGSHDVAASSEIDDSSGPRIPIRALWFHETPSLESVFERTGADDMQDRLTFRRPAVWSTVMLTNHVETLVTIPPRLVNRRTKDKTYVAGTLRTNSYQQQIIAELLRCFSDPSASACVSRAAVDHALDYFVRHSNFLAVRQLLAILQDNSEYTLTTTNFDIFLAAAAANEDVHNFRLWLRNMLREELKPSPRTWASLHRLVCRRYPGTEMPGRVLSAMRAKGVLTDPETVREWLRDNVERRLTAYLASKTKSEDVDLDAFMSMYDKRYRLPLNQHQLSDARHSSAEQYRPWLTTVTTNIMAKVLLAHGRTQDALAVVRMYEDSGGPLRADTINTFLNAAERARDTGFAVSVLKYFAASAARSSRPAGKGIRLDAISYSTLFNVAWTRKNYNMLRVIWRYACCAGEVRWMVHQMVRTSLLKYVPATTSRRQLEREQGEVRLAEAVESVLKGSKAKKHTSENKEVNVRSRRGEVWSGWVGNFVVGLTDGIEDNRKDTGARAATSSAKSASENDASLHNLAQLTPYAAEMLALATQPRRKPLVISPTEQDPFDTPKTVSLPAHYARRTRLQALLDEDLAQTLHLTPMIPLPELLERAWEMDMQWNEQRLGAPTEAMTWAFYDREATEEQKAGVFVGMFEEMLVKGIEVPVKRVRRQGERGREQKEKEGGRWML